MSSNIKIAVSGKSGCGNTTVSRLTAEKLGFSFINYTFHSMAEEREMSFEEFYKLAQEDISYDIILDRKQVELARRGSCVLGSRLAIWMLEEADLKVYLEASLETRARRISSREGGSVEEKMRKTESRDRKDHERYMKIYGIDNDSYDFADLILPVDRIDQYEAADRIVEAFKHLNEQRGMDVR
ncbi:MAG: (d)CMP kinase [Spirochaetaceae bacterium]